jgi:hypothetical protein
MLLPKKKLLHSVVYINTCLTIMATNINPYRKADKQARLFVGSPNMVAEYR